MNCSSLAFLSVGGHSSLYLAWSAQELVCLPNAGVPACVQAACLVLWCTRTSLFWGGSMSWYWCLTFCGLFPCSISSTKVWYSFGKTKWLCPSYFPLFREILVEPREKKQSGAYKHIDWTWHGENISLRMSLPIFPVFGKCSFVFKSFGFRKLLLLKPVEDERASLFDWRATPQYRGSLQVMLRHCSILHLHDSLSWTSFKS